MAGAQVFLLSVPSGLVLPRHCPIHTKSPLVLRLIAPSALEIPAPPTLAPRLLVGWGHIFEYNYTCLISFKALPSHRPRLGFSGAQIGILESGVVIDTKVIFNSFLPTLTRQDKYLRHGARLTKKSVRHSNVCSFLILKEFRLWKSLQLFGIINGGVNPSPLTWFDDLDWSTAGSSRHHHLLSSTVLLSFLSTYILAALAQLLFTQSVHSHALRLRLS